MAINPKKGQTINLEKDQFDLSNVTIGLGWDVMKKEKGFWSTLFSNEEDEDYDLDAIAFLLDENGKVANVGNQRLEGGHELFNGEYHLCSRSSNATFIGMVKRNEGDYVNIRHKNNPEKRKKAKKELRQILRRTRYIAACEHCMGNRSQNPIIADAEQLPVNTYLDFNGNIIRK